jgi:3D (Asp-Asp-Asp) domain-containing protein
MPASSAEGSSCKLRADAVAYSLPGKTASGLPVGTGVVAVDPKLIPLRTRLFVPGYGKAVAADVGTAVKGAASSTSGSRRPRRRGSGVARRS